jgi:uncharacterized OB-fold protein
MHPRPTEEDAPFWNACQNEKLTFQRCCACGQWRHPPAFVCPNCQSQSSSWNEAVGLIELYSWTRIWTAAHPAMAPELPYIVGIFAFRACGGIRLAARLLDVPSNLTPRIGAACILCWRRLEDGYLIPAFRQPAAMAPPMT